MLEPIPTYLSLSQDILEVPRAFCPECRVETRVEEGRLACCGFTAGDIFAAPKITARRAPKQVAERPRVRSDTRRPRRIRRRQPGRFEKLCDHCGQTMEVKREGKRFCCTSCRGAAHDAVINPRLRDCCTIAELAASSGTSVAAIRRKIRSGEIVAHKIGPMYVLGRSALVSRLMNKEPVPLIRPEVAAVFRSFAGKHHLSVRKMGALLGIGKSSAQRLLAGTATEDFLKTIIHTLPPELSDRLPLEPE